MQELGERRASAPWRHWPRMARLSAGCAAWQWFAAVISRTSALVERSALLCEVGMLVGVLGVLLLRVQLPVLRAGVVLACRFGVGERGCAFVGWSGELGLGVPPRVRPRRGHGGLRRLRSVHCFVRWRRRLCLDSA
jgi:hypothetical protein